MTNPFPFNDAVSGHSVLRFTGESVAFSFTRISDIRTAFWVVSKDQSAFGKNNEKFVLGDKVYNDFHAGMTDDTRTIANAFNALGTTRVHMLSLSSTGINLTVIVDEEQVTSVMQRLHAAYFPEHG